MRNRTRIRDFIEWGDKQNAMPYEFKRLADYNTRVSEGIVHTAEYVAEMAELQADFNAWIARGRVS